MDEFIDAMLEDNPNLTTRELNRMLRRQFGTHISKGRIAYGDEFIDLQDYQVEALRANDRKAWQHEHPPRTASFSPSPQRRGTAQTFKFSSHAQAYYHQRRFS